MEIKEGIVLDREDGTPHQRNTSFHEQGGSAAPSNIRVFRGGWGLVALLAVVIPLVLVAGIFMVAIAAAAFIFFWLIRMLLGGPTNGPGRSVLRR